MYQNLKVNLKLIRFNSSKRCICIQKARLYNITTTEIVTEEIDFLYNIPNNGFVKIKETNIIIETQTMTIDRYKNGKVDKMSKGFDSNKIKGGMVVRSRQQGDKIKLAGGSKKIKDLFIDLKIPREERCKVPVIAVNKVYYKLVNISLVKIIKQMKKQKKS